MDSERGNSSGRGASDRNNRPNGNGNTDIGDALRSVYDEATREDIPAEMLDLLGKLS